MKILTTPGSAWAPDDLIEAVKKRIKPLSGRVAVLVNLDKQTEDWNEGVLIPDKAQALMDRGGMGTPRCGTVAVSAAQDVAPGDHYLVDADEGQWWMATEAENRLDLILPLNWQLRIYLDTNPLIVRLPNDN